MSKEAMKLALEALENTTPTGFNMESDKKFFAAITALREALAEQAAQQEPFGYFRYDLRLDAWVQNREGKPGTAFYTSPPAQQEPVAIADGTFNHNCPVGTPLYTSPPAQQEPAAWGVDWGKAGDIPCVSIIKRLPGENIEVVAVEYAPYSYTSPPAQRKPLTDEEIASIIVEMNGNEPTAPFWRDLARAIEAAHGIKE